ncbi:MAG TPA: phosphotransferase, partial [Bryobacteraceae bacterium]
MSLQEEHWPILADALARHLPQFRSLKNVTQLTAGASLETYRLDVELKNGLAALALRRTPGGAAKLSDRATPSLEVEAKLIRVARDHGVPEPGIHFVLEEADGLGQGFVMEWLDGETLGGRIVRSEALADARPRLARQCGEILGRIHSIDITATGLKPF